SGWTVIFRSADPSIWNTDTNRGKDTLAVPLAKVPAGVKYLRMANAATGEYVVVEMTRERLGGRTEQAGYGWNGKNDHQYKAYHLGVYDLATAGPSTKGAVCIHSPGAYQTCRGWGFGERVLVNDAQGYSWAGEQVEKAVFEVAVKATPLTPEEAKRLLKRKQGR